MKVKTKFEAQFEGHNINRKGFSKITFKASHTELRKTLKLGLMVGKSCVITIDYAKEEIDVLDEGVINKLLFDRDGECKVVFESDEIVDGLTSNLEGLSGGAVFILQIESDDGDDSDE